MHGSCNAVLSTKNKKDSQIINRIFCHILPLNTIEKKVAKCSGIKLCISGKVLIVSESTVPYKFANPVASISIIFSNIFWIMEFRSMFKLEKNSCKEIKIYSDAHDMCPVKEISRILENYKCFHYKGCIMCVGYQMLFWISNT